MKSRLLIIIGVAIVISFVIGWQIGISTFYYTDDPNKVAERSYMFSPDTPLSYAEYEELECLRLYKNIRELSHTPEIALADQQTITIHKNLVFEYVEKNCPDFPDLEFIYDNYKQNILESESHQKTKDHLPAINSKNNWVNPELELKQESEMTFDYVIESDNVTYGSQYQISDGIVDEITYDAHSNSLIISLNESEKGHI